MEKYDIEYMTSKEFEERTVLSHGLLLPLGSTEILGTHGPLGTDNLIAKTIIPLLAKKTGCLAAPLIPYGDTLEIGKEPGTVHVPEQILRELYLAVSRSFLRTKTVQRLYFVNFHSLNNRAADNACRVLQDEGNQIFLIDWWKAAGIQAQGILNDKQFGTGHGGEMITSVLLSCVPQTVQIESAGNTEPKDRFAFYAKYLYNSGNSFFAYGNFKKYCDSGAWGEISHATAEKGKIIVEKTICSIADFIFETFQMT